MISNYLLVFFVIVILLKSYKHYQYCQDYKKWDSVFEEYINYLIIAIPIFIPSKEIQDKDQQKKSILIMWLGIVSVVSLITLFLLIHAGV